MATTIPLVRAGALAPHLTWMRSAGRDIEHRLQAAGLLPDLLPRPEHHIPLRRAIDFMVAGARAEGPDLGCRVVTGESPGQLGPISQAYLLGQTPRQVLAMASRAFSHHSSHEHLTLETIRGGMVVRYMLRVRVDAEARHCVHQFMAAVVKAICGETGHTGPLVAKVAIVPHPQAGLGHLQANFDGGVVPADGVCVEITLINAVLDRSFPGRQSLSTNGVAVLPLSSVPLGRERSLSSSICRVLPDLLQMGDVSVATLAGLAFSSVRTLQRRLAAEGTSVSRLIDETRRGLALQKLGESPTLLEDIALQIGYSSSSSFSRSVRRWTGQPPRRFRAG